MSDINERIAKGDIPIATPRVGIPKLVITAAASTDLKSKAGNPANHIDPEKGEKNEENGIHEGNEDIKDVVRSDVEIAAETDISSNVDDHQSGGEGTADLEGPAAVQTRPDEDLEPVKEVVQVQESPVTEPTVKHEQNYESEPHIVNEDFHVEVEVHNEVDHKTNNDVIDDVATLEASSQDMTLEESAEAEHLAEEVGEPHAEESKTEVTTEADDVTSGPNDGNHENPQDDIVAQEPIVHGDHLEKDQDGESNEQLVDEGHNHDLIHAERVIEEAFSTVETTSTDVVDTNVFVDQNVDDRGASNEDVLNKIAEEADTEEERMSVGKLLAWAKSTRKSKSETMKVREKKKQDSFKRAVDINAVPIIIEDKPAASAKSVEVKKVQSERRTFQVTSPASSSAEAISSSDVALLSKSWLESVVSAFEEVSGGVTVMSMNVEKLNNGHLAAHFVVKFSDMTERAYKWTFKKTMANKISSDNNGFAVNDFGTKLTRHYKKASRGGKAVITPIPFDFVVFADHRFTVMENINDYNPFKGSGDGLPMDFIKIALKSLARMHAISFSYFNSIADEPTKQAFIDQDYQANSPNKANVKDRLTSSFNAVLELLQSLGSEGVVLAEKAKARFGNRLYTIFSDALQPNSSFTSLCHGFPLESDFIFSLDGDKPVDAKIRNFSRARMAHPITDALVLLNTAMGPKVDEQSGFLLRFVYFDTLSATLKTIGLDNKIDFDSMKKEIKAKSTYAAIAAAIHLATDGRPSTMTPSPSAGAAVGRIGGKRSFTSKILGNFSNNTSVEAREVIKMSTPAYRVKTLIEKIISEF